eukprot:6202275-Pleurochrysis_carterae.AAC.2
MGAVSFGYAHARAREGAHKRPTLVCTFCEHDERCVAYTDSSMNKSFAPARASTCENTDVRSQWHARSSRARARTHAHAHAYTTALDRAHHRK